MKLRNPFITSGYAGKEYFCDRKKETQKLIAALENDRNVTLMAPRRYGKTGLIHNVFATMPKEFTGIYFDIYSVHDLSAFVRLFAENVFESLGTRKEKVLSSIAKFLKSCRPTATPQEDGSVKFSIDVAPSTAEASLKEVFAYLQTLERPVVIAIDEFQQVREFPERGVEALLRSYIQFVPNVRFIFAGSRRHLMCEMFVSPQGPFYQSTQILDLLPIPCGTYGDFASSLFKSGGRTFEKAVFDALYARYDGITWYLQAILNKIWEYGEDLQDFGQVLKAEADLCEERALVYRDLYVAQNASSKLVLRAIAERRVVAEPNSADFLSMPGLPGASTVRAALKDLDGKDIIYRSEAGWIVYDRLFGEWLRTSRI